MAFYRCGAERKLTIDDGFFIGEANIRSITSPSIYFSSSELAAGNNLATTGEPLDSFFGDSFAAGSILIPRQINESTPKIISSVDIYWNNNIEYFRDFFNDSSGRCDYEIELIILAPAGEDGIVIAGVVQQNVYLRNIWSSGSWGFNFTMSNFAGAILTIKPILNTSHPDCQNMTIDYIYNFVYEPLHKMRLHLGVGNKT